MAKVDFDIISDRGLRPDQRNYPAQHSIDPGFVNYRLLQSFLPPLVWKQLDELVGGIPGSIEHFASVRGDHFLTRCALELCRKIGAPTLSGALTSPDVRRGQIICSSDFVRGKKSVYSAKRVSLDLVTGVRFARKAILELSTRHISSSTTRGDLADPEGTFISYIGTTRRSSADKLVIAPLIPVSVKEVVV